MIEKGKDRGGYRGSKKGDRGRSSDSTSHRAHPCTICDSGAVCPCCTNTGQGTPASVEHKDHAHGGYVRGGFISGYHDEDDDIWAPLTVFEQQPLQQLSGAYRAVRLWKLTSDNRLRGFVYSYLWEPGVNTAVSTEFDEWRSRIHWNGRVGPGLHGFLSNEEMITQETVPANAALGGYSFLKNDLEFYGLIMPSPYERIDYAIGTTMNWGKVVEGTKGLRSKYAIPESLVLSSDLDWNIRLMECADHYGIPVVSQDQLNENRYGFIEGWSLPQ